MRTTGYKASTARGSTVAAPGAQPMQEELPVLVTEAEGKAEYTQGDCWRGTPPASICREEARPVPEHWTHV